MTKTARGGTARLRSTAVCTLRLDVAAGGAGSQVNMLGDAKTLDECCDACTTDVTCALFVALPQALETSDHIFHLHAVLGNQHKRGQADARGGVRRAEAGAAAARPNSSIDVACRLLTCVSACVRVCGGGRRESS